MFDAIARPFGMLLMYFYNLVNNYGVAIILIAIVIKVILLPFQMKSKRGMIQQARLQPKIAELQKKHGTNKAKINEETMKLYKEEGVNPASGCIWGFLPLPIMLALFQVIRRPITMMMGVTADAYAEMVAKLEEMPAAAAVLGEGYYVEIAQLQFISDSRDFHLFEQISENLRRIDFSFLNLNFSITPQWDYLWNANPDVGITWFAGFLLFLIPLISGGMQFLATGINRKLNPPAMVEGQAKQMNTMMMFMPLISVYIGFITPAALGFYWTVSTVFQIIQDVWLNKVYTKRIEAEEALKNEERKKKEAELEAKRLETERRKAEGVAERNPNTSKRKKQKSEKQGQIEKAVEWQKKNAPEDEAPEYEPSRVGKRRYARGRAYDPDRYANTGVNKDKTKHEDTPEDTEEADTANEKATDAVAEVTKDDVQDDAFDDNNGESGDKSDDEYDGGDESDGGYDEDEYDEDDEDDDDDDDEYDDESDEANDDEDEYDDSDDSQ